MKRWKLINECDIQKEPILIEENNYPDAMGTALSILQYRVTGPYCPECGGYIADPYKCECKKERN